jgi:hypothetical protein
MAITTEPTNLNTPTDSIAPSGEDIEDNRFEFLTTFDRRMWGTTGTTEIVGCLLALFAWFLLFAGGVLISSAPYVNRMTAEGGLADVSAAVMIILFWTITNVGILSLLAAVLGAFGRRTQFMPNVTEQLRNPLQVGGRRSSVSILYASAIIRGFAVYALVLSGLLLLNTEVLIQPAQGQYVRLAALASAVSFYVGYDPSVFTRLLDRIKRFLENE